MTDRITRAIIFLVVLVANEMRRLRFGKRISSLTRILLAELKVRFLSALV